MHIRWIPTVIDLFEFPGRLFSWRPVQLLPFVGTRVTLAHARMSHDSVLNAHTRPLEVYVISFPVRQLQLYS